MDLSKLTAISPVDGRYRSQGSSLSPYFSEFGLMKYRVMVEVEYFIALCELPLPQLADFDKSLYPSLRNLYETFVEEDALQIKEIERETNHDVKAVEYFIKKHFDKLQIDKYKEFIHFGLTSQDINNTAIPYSLKEAMRFEVQPLIGNLSKKINELAAEWKDIPMLARTHGQPASPTVLGKELLVFTERISKQLDLLITIPYAAKFGGATGNFNAHHVAYPETDWVQFGSKFLSESLGLHRSHPTTQIEHYDNLAALCDNMRRINVILMDLSKDVWQYVAMNYFKQKIKEGEVGSSAMPHKVNPIDFENAEGNLGIANALFDHLAAKLPISRLQRDLTDSTVLRNIGVPFAHSLIAYNSLLKGLNKLELNKSAIDADLEANWAVVAEAIQTILRREGYPHPYETLKRLTRKNTQVTQETIHEFIHSLDLPYEVKEEMMQISPFTYTGIRPDFQ